MTGCLVRPEVDVCLVGLGAAGSMASYVLTQAGRRVVALEAGPARSGLEHAMDELPSNGVRNTWGGKFNRELPTWRANARSPRQPTRYYMRMSNGVGGSTVAYAAASLRFHPDDFRVRSNTMARYGPRALPEGSDVTDWPLSYDDLEPYYDQAERLLGVSGQAGNLRGRIVPGGNPFEGPRQHPYPVRPLRTSGLGALFGEVAARAGYHPFPAPAAILSEPYDGRQGCTYCSFCASPSCHVGAKGSTLVTVLPRALATGNLEIRTGCRAVRVVVDDHGEAVGVEYEGPAGRELQPAGLVILAAYTFENARLLLLSRSHYFPRGLGNNGGQVGRAFITRQHPHVFGLFRGRRLNRFIGPDTQGQTIDDLNADNFDHTGLGFIRGARVTAGSEFPPLGSSAHLPPDVPRWGQAYKKFLVQNYNSIAMLRINPEILPYDANFLDLDPEVHDPLGQPVIRITFSLYENERRLMTFLQARVIELLRAMGADTIWPNPFFTAMVSSHDVGGTRIGSDPARSVADSYGRLHEAPRVFVLGGSTFPTLPGLNPTLTIQALALRSAEHLVQMSAG